MKIKNDYLFYFTLLFFSQNSFALDVEATAKALRLVNTITGGYMPVTDMTFPAVVEKIKSNDLQGAALLVTRTSYYTNYLARRLAFQMQSSAMTATGMTDNDATAFLIAHFSDATGSPAISSIWSENATYLVNFGGTPVHASSLTPAQAATVNWQTSLTRVAGQNAKALNGTAVAIPVKHVGGYITLSNAANDNSFAMFGALAGTNLRMIEGLWKVATGFTLVDVQSSLARPQDVPRFVPEYDESFFVGQGQSSCISCHGGGFSSLNHGYSAVADVFDYKPDLGLVYIATPTTATRKSLGSDAAKRAANSTCNLALVPTPVCNPDSAGADANQAWDLTKTWSNTGVLLRMGWTGETRGEGLNSLGVALGKAAVVYQFLAKRVISEICPMGVFSQQEIKHIAAAANPFSTIKGTDDVRTIVALVAAHSTCQ